MSNEPMGNQNPHPWSRDAWSGSGGRPEGPSNPTSSQPGPAFQPSDPQAGQQGQPQPDPGRTPWQPPTPEQYGPQRPAQPQPAGSWYDTPPQYRPAPQAATTQKSAKRRTGLAGMLAVAVLAGGIGGGTGVTLTRMLEDQPTATSTTTDSGSQGTTTEVVQADPANPNWSVVAQAAADSVVAIQVMGNGSGGQGSGVVIDNEGHIVTNNHVIAGSGQGATITVLLGTTSYEAEVVGTDPSTDLAVIKFVDPPAELSVMSYGDVDDLNVGDPVMAIGNPLGLADTVTTGIISALDRPVTTRAVGNTTMAQGDDLVVTAAIQTNAAINPGNSGGALVNGSGELIGITSSIAALPSAGSAQAGNIGIGFAIGADQVKYVADQLIESGVAKHPRIGVSASDVRTTGQVGAEVATVVDGSPAAEAGIQVGDLITAVDGKPVMNMESLVALVRAGQVGQEMKLTVQRGGQEQELTVIPIAASR